nr:glutamine synthetase [Streptomyces avermitilis]
MARRRGGLRHASTRGAARATPALHCRADRRTAAAGSAVRTHPQLLQTICPPLLRPTNYTWGRDNRTCAIRITGHHACTHLEVRLPGADANPYLALAATIAAIVYGLNNHPKLPEPCTGDAYHAADPLPVPRNLEEALTDFQQSSIALRAFSTPVVQHYARAAEVEIEAQHGQVTDIDRKRGFLRA